MNPAMKQRLVGTIVLGSLALILIPLLLDGEGVERPPLSATVPPAPVFDTAPLPAPARPEILADPLGSDTALPAEAAPATPVDPAAEQTAETPAASPAADLPATTAETATATPLPTAPPAEVLAAEPAAAAPELATPPPASTSEPALSADGLPETWAVRLGSFGNRANADALFERLLTAGYKAYIRPVMSGDVALSGVFVGPVLTQNEAVALQAELKTKYQINDVIVQRYDIAQ